MDKKYIEKLKALGGEHYYYCICSKPYVVQIRTKEENPRCPICKEVMIYGRYW